MANLNEEQRNEICINKCFMQSCLDNLAEIMKAAPIPATEVCDMQWSLSGTFKVIKALITCPLDRNK